MSESKEAWVLTQKRTFTKWFNTHLTKKKFAPIDDAELDFENGIKLMQIVHALYELPIPKHNANPKLRPHKLDNLQLAFNMVEQAKIKTNFLKPTHLLDHDLKMILGFMFAIIVAYRINGISEEQMSAKEALLLWCRKKTAGYRDVDPPGVQNFTTHFRNGLALCALIHKHQPHLIDYDSLQASDAAKNIELAFSVAEKDLGIPRLLDVDDLLIERPDERSVMTYVAEYWNRFAAQEAKEQSARRARKFVALVRESEANKNNYEQRARELLAWITETVQTFEGASLGDTVDEAQAVIERLKTFVLEEEPKRAASKLDLESLFAQIQTERKVNKFQPYVPPTEVSPDAIEEAYHRLYAARQVYARRARDHRFTFIKSEDASQVSESKIAEFRESFQLLDTDRDNFLNKNEFKIAASAVGINFKDDAELGKVFHEVSGGEKKGISEEQYVQYMVSLAQDRNTPEQIRASFAQLANDKDTITADQLLVPPITNEDAEFLASVLPKADDGSFDYKAFIAATYASEE